MRDSKSCLATVQAPSPEALGRILGVHVTFGIPEVKCDNPKSWNDILYKHTAFVLAQDSGALDITQTEMFIFQPVAAGEDAIC